MKIQITCQLSDNDEYADPGHEMGVTSAGYDMIVDALISCGLDDINVEKVE